jgi:hypothetical protein
MKPSPSTSPWPAPTLDDLVLADAVNEPVQRNSRGAGQPSGANAPRARRDRAVVTGKRLSSRSERAEHAAMKEEQRITLELDDLPAGWFVLHSLDIDPGDDAARSTTSRSARAASS